MSIKNPPKGGFFIVVTLIRMSGCRLSGQLTFQPDLFRASEYNHPVFQSLKPIFMTGSKVPETEFQTPSNYLLNVRAIMKKWNWKHIILFILAIPVLNHLAGYLGKNAAQHVNEKDVESRPVQAAAQNIRVIVSSQDAEGVTQNNLDMTFLKNLEAYTVEGISAKIRELPNSPQIDITSEATYLESGTMKLAIIRIRGSDNSNQVIVLGVVGNELKRVGCLRRSTETIPISYGICADKIQEIFGTKIGA